MPTFSHPEPTEPGCPAAERMGTTMSIKQIIESAVGAPVESTVAYAKRVWLAFGMGATDQDREVGE